MGRFIKNGWGLSAFLIIFFFVLPVGAVFYQSTTLNLANLQHLWQTVLWDYTWNSLRIVAGTLFFSLLFALPSAWFLSYYQFPTRKILQWAMCLPLAIPPYLLGYLYTDLLDFTGGVQVFLRQLFHWQSINDYWFPDIRSLWGASFVLALVLYPYIFLLVRLALMEQGEQLQQAGRLLGANKRKVFFKILLPLTRPAIIAGCALVAMETLGDFGTVSYFSIPTLTTAIYDTWLGYGDLGSAAQISAFLLLFVFSFLFLEHYNRRKQKIFQRNLNTAPRVKSISKTAQALILIFCWGLVTIGFIAPIGTLLYWAIRNYDHTVFSDFFIYGYHSLLVSCIAAVICVGLALVLHFYHRLNLQRGKRSQRLSQTYLQLGRLSYAIPGTVLAIGLLIPFTFAEHQLNNLLEYLHLSRVGLVFTGTIVGLVLAYVIRFAAMALSSIETAMQQIPPSLDLASRSLGHSPVKTLQKVHLPLLKGGMITALLMVFIEAIKELNASLLLRPFNFDTLVTYVFAYTSDEQLEQAALPALVLIFVGMIPVIWLTYFLLNTKKQKAYDYS